MIKHILSLCLITLPFTAMSEGIVTKGDSKQIIGKTCTSITITQKTGDTYEYCMTPIANKEIISKQTPATKKVYQLLTSNNFTTEHQGATGNMAFIFQEVSIDNNEVLSEDEFFNIQLGEFGKAPSDFQFRDLGKGNFGYIIESDYNDQGIKSGGINIVGEYDGKLFKDYIPTHADNYGYVGDKALAETITYKMVFIKDKEETVYPIEIILNGQYKENTYDNQSFIFNFDLNAGQYIKPEGYPLTF